MKVKNEIVFNDYFAKAFIKLLKCSFDAEISMQIVETFSKLNEQQKNVFAVRDSLLDRFACKGIDGKIKFTDGSISFKDKNSEEEFIAEMNKLLNLEFEIPLEEKITLDKKIQISGEEILILKPVLNVKF